MPTDKGQMTVFLCPNCNGHLASIGQGLRECEQCGKIQKEEPPMPWMLITCGHCGHADDIDAFCRTPVSGPLPKDVYQCPACNCAVRRRMAPPTVYPSGWVKPGKITLEPIAARL